MSQIIHKQSPRDVRTQRWNDEARSVLRDAPYAELRQAICRVEAGRCVLSGKFRSFYLKQLAQSLFLNQVSHNLPLENQLRIQLESEGSF